MTCWIDTERPDPHAAARFYAGLFGWEFTGVSPTYRVATLDGLDVAAIRAAGAGPVAWNTYVAVDDADATAAAVSEGGGTVTSAPADAGTTIHVFTPPDAW